VGNMECEDGSPRSTPTPAKLRGARGIPDRMEMS
jgi:hypothetical protein